MAKANTQGWHFQSERHSRARKTGRAGGKYLMLPVGHKAKPTRPINDSKSRYAYKLDRFKGEWELDSVNPSESTFTYKKLSKETRKLPKFEKSQRIQ